MDINKYINLLNKKEELEQEIRKINEEISLILDKKRKKINDKIKSIFLEVFNKEELFWSNGQINEDFRSYVLKTKNIRYEIDITKFLVDNCFLEFKGTGKMDRRGKYKIYLIVDYNIINNTFNLFLFKKGLYSVFRDSTLQRSIYKMISHAEEVANKKDLDLIGLKSSFIEVKEVLNSYMSYYVTEELKK